MSPRNDKAAQMFSALLDSTTEQTIRLSEKDSIMFAGFPDLLEVKHLEIILGCSGNTVRGLIKSGELPGRKVGERFYVPKPRLIEFFVGDGRGGDE